MTVTRQNKINKQIKYRLTLEARPITPDDRALMARLYAQILATQKARGCPVVFRVDELEVTVPGHLSNPTFIELHGVAHQLRLAGIWAEVGRQCIRP